MSDPAAAEGSAGASPSWALAPTDEARHPAGPEALWGESWYLDWAAPDASSGGYVRLGLYPNLGRAWWWIAVVGADERTVLVVDHDLPCPEGPRAHPQLAWPEPFQAFRVTDRSRGVRLREPADAFRGLDGDPVDVEVDLTWTSRGAVFPYAMTTRYEISSWVHGTVRVDDTTVAVDCAGQRDHSWGVRDWWLFPWNWTSGHLDDGTFFHAARSIIPDLDLFATGYTIAPGAPLAPVDRVEVDVEVDDEALPTVATQQIGSIGFRSEPVGHAPLLLVADDGRETRFPRAMCRYTTSDGRSGSGWTEYNWPPGWPQR